MTNRKTRSSSASNKSKTKKFGDEIHSDPTIANAMLLPIFYAIDCSSPEPHYANAHRYNSRRRACTNTPRKPQLGARMHIYSSTHINILPRTPLEEGEWIRQALHMFSFAYVFFPPLLFSCFILTLINCFGLWPLSENHFTFMHPEFIIFSHLARSDFRPKPMPESTSLFSQKKKNLVWFEFSS